MRLRDTLSRIAFDEYGDGAQWRRIADANQALAADPRRLVPGTRLVIPAGGVFGKSTGQT